MPNSFSVRILEVQINDFSIEQLLDIMFSCLLSEQKIIISNVNIHAINLAYSDPEFRSLLNNSAVTFCDGVGIKIAALLTGQKLNNRYTPPDFIDRICEIASQKNARIFFLGGRSGVSEKAADIMKKRFPDLCIDSYHGYFDKSPSGNENAQVINKINAFGADILFVGFGMPLQEKWIAQNKASLTAQVFFPVGALFDYITQEVWRAPRWVTDNGFEWLARFLVEPGRLWKRYMIGNPLFFWRIFIHHILGYPLPKGNII